MREWVTKFLESLGFVRLIDLIQLSNKFQDLLNEHQELLSRIEELEGKLRESEKREPPTLDPIMKGHNNWLRQKHALESRDRKDFLAAQKRKEDQQKEDYWREKVAKQNQVS